MRHEWVVRLDYGRIIPWVRRRDIRGEEAITAVAGPDKLILRGSRLPDRRRPPPRRRVRRRGRRVADLLDDLDPVLRAHAHRAPTRRSRRPSPPRASGRAACPADVPHADVVRRSLLTLRLMTHEQTGGIVAAPTTSLPEDFGGERNWDYRYCWLRDAALTLESLVDAGYTDEAGLWRHWLLRAVAGDPEDLQIMYTVDGARHLPEHTLDHLPGYEGSRPVRIGNAAVEQKQTDVLGEVMIALAAARSAGHRRRRRRLGPAAVAGRPPGRHLARARPRASGRSAAPSGTSPIRGRWSGRRSTGPSGPSRSRAWKGRSTAGARSATQSARRS